MKALIILGNQLFDPKILVENGLDPKTTAVFIREDAELCTYYKFHKHKVIFFLAAMRTYAEELTAAGFDVHYQELKPSDDPYETHFLKFYRSKKLQDLVTFEIEDKFFEKRLKKMATQNKIDYRSLRSPMFLTSRSEFAQYLSTTKKPFMKNFYEKQRKVFNVLVDQDKKPIGGKWSFDDQNRLSLPESITPPALPSIKSSTIVKSVSKVCDTHFSSHPGDSKDFWLPVKRSEAQDWLESFLDERLAHFGPYEDAIPEHSVFLFHSVLTPFLNTGLLTPEEVVRRTLKVAQKKKIAIQSVEGFIRQIIGWREFIRGIYQNFSEVQDKSNFWNHERKLSSHWYSGQTGIPPLDLTLNKVIRYGYAHHIERLMVVGSLMLLLEVKPSEAHRWFMEMFIDSSDWVMGPNVYGMALFSDGGIFATKPYICGSNYYRKMGKFKKAEWCDGVDGLYWQFIDKHKSFFLKNPRLSMIARTVEKMDPERKAMIFKAADLLRAKLTK